MNVSVIRDVACDVVITGSLVSTCRVVIAVPSLSITGIKPLQELQYRLLRFIVPRKIVAGARKDYQLRRRVGTRQLLGMVVWDQIVGIAMQQQAQAALRFSLGRGTTIDQVDTVADALTGIIKKLRELSSL